MIRLNIPEEVSRLVEPQEFFDNGCFGNLWKVTKKSSNNLGDGKVYVMKILNDQSSDLRIRESVVNEFRILSEIKNPYITNLDTYIWTRDASYIIMDYYPNHNLVKVINDADMRDSPLAEDEIWKYFIQVCLGLESLHSRDFIHRDIRPQNILLNEDWNAKLTGFDLSVYSFATEVVGIPCLYSPRSYSRRPEDAQIKRVIFGLLDALYIAFAIFSILLRDTKNK